MALRVFCSPTGAFPCFSYSPVNRPVPQKGIKRFVRTRNKAVGPVWAFASKSDALVYNFWWFRLISNDLVCDSDDLIWFLMIWLYELAVYLILDWLVWIGLNNLVVWFEWFCGLVWIILWSGLIHLSHPSFSTARLSRYNHYRRTIILFEK